MFCFWLSCPVSPRAIDSRLIRSITTFVLFVLTATDPILARTAIIGPAAVGDRLATRPFAVGWLCRRDGGGGVYADLRQGLRVDVLETGAGGAFHRVRVPYPDRRVIRQDSSWPETEGGATGWVRADQLQLTTDGPSSTSNGEQIGVAEPAGDMDPGRSEAAASSDWVGSTEGREDPDSRQTIESTPSAVHYVFCATGKDGAYFETLALGQPSDVMNMVRDDIQATRAVAGLSESVKIVRVRVSTPGAMLDVLKNGRIPKDGRDTPSIYTPNQLVQSSVKITGFAVVSHAGSYGPMIPYPDYKQFTYPPLQDDKKNGGPNTLSARLAQGARIRYTGCNSGNDHQFYEVDEPGKRGNPSIAHATASIYADKKVVTYGKFNSGDIKSTHYMWFACPDGQNYPIRYGKPKTSYSFSAIGQRFSRDSGKPESLKSAIQAVDSNPQGGWSAVQKKVTQAGVSGDLLKKVETAVTSGKLAKAIRESKAANGGKLDLDDFRLWVVLLRPAKWDTEFRADLCDDANVAQSKFRP